MSRAGRYAFAVSAVLLAAAAARHLTEPRRPAGPADAAPPPICAGVPPAPPPSVFLAELTWVEVCAALANGVTTALVPTGGVEQNGPHVVLGKHDHVVRATSERIAGELGDALVAPVVSYVPEGRIDPPEGHMAFPGTLSVPDAVFEALLESAARSLRQAGFRRVAFIGDSGMNQRPQERVARRLAREWGKGSALSVSDYYFANGQLDWLRSQGETDAAIGTHAGIRDTSEVMAAHPAGVRDAARRAGLPAESGVDGDPSRASAERGEKMLQLKVQAAVRQLRRD